MAETLWATKLHPAWHEKTQALVHSDGKSFDRIGYEAADGTHKTWFDITAFFGKL